MAVKIIGISGRARSGKDTLANHLVDQDYAHSKIAIAHELKMMCCRLFGVPYEDFNTDKKDQPSSVKVIESMCQLIPELTPRIGDHLTPREILQFFGTSVLRKFDPDCLVRATINLIKDKGDEVWIIPDVRLENEIDAIRAMGGFVIRLTRNPLNLDHYTETALDNYKNFDVVVDNRNQSEAETLDIVTRVLVKDKLINKVDKTLGELWKMQ